MRPLGLCGELTRTARVRGPMAATMRVDVQVEARRVQRDANRLAAGGEDEQLVEEPGRREEDDLVARVDQRPQGDAMAAKPPLVIATSAGSQSMPVRCGQRGGDGPLRGRLGQLVGEPVLVLRHGVALQRLDVAGERHLLGIADREVRDVGMLVELRERAAEEGEEGRDALADPVALPGRLDGGHGRGLSHAWKPAPCCALPSRRVRGLNKAVRRDGNGGFFAV